MRKFLLSLLLPLLFSLLPASLLFISASSLANDRPTILVLGDSLSAAHGIGQGQGWVSLLARQLQDEHFPYQVANISISGETSQGGLNRLPAALQRHRPAIVLIELGANDGLRGLPLTQLRRNLTQMIELSRKTGAKVLLLGMRLPPNYGPAYTHGFTAIYSQLANEQDVALVPFLLKGVVTRRGLMQADNLHPTAQAQPILLDTVWAYLEPLLRLRAESKGEGWG
jgi:acyl-CoA thioesterase-1